MPVSMGPVSKRGYLWWVPCRSAGIYGGSRVEAQVSTKFAGSLGEERMEPTAGEEPPAKKKKGEKGYPPGILDHRTGKLQARLPGFKVDGKACQKPIPGLHDNV